MRPVTPSDLVRSRRGILSAGVALAAGYAGLSRRSFAAEPAAADGHPLANGGTDPFPIPWLDKNGSHNQPAGPNFEPSHVFHFKGKVGRCAGFTGTGVDGQGNRIPFGFRTTDYGFMDGEYWAGRTAHRAALTHIWLTLFRGQLAPANQFHDFHPPISPNELYWVVPIPEGGLRYADDGRTATLQMKNVAVVDQPRWPALDATTTPATMSFNLVFKAADQKVVYNDPSKHFRVTGFLAAAQLEAEVSVPEIGFTWKSDPLETSKCDFAVLGDEVNGKYYDGR